MIASGRPNVFEHHPESFYEAPAERLKGEVGVSEMQKTKPIESKQATELVPGRVYLLEVNVNEMEQHEIEWLHYEFRRLELTVLLVPTSTGKVLKFVEPPIHAFEQPLPAMLNGTEPSREPQIWYSAGAELWWMEPADAKEAALKVMAYPDAIHVTNAWTALPGAFIAKLWRDR